MNDLNFDWISFQEQLDEGKPSIRLFQQALKTFRQQLCDAFSENVSVTTLVKYLVNFTDQLLIHAWQFYQLDTHKKLALIALGGYGRAELHPHSDIDFLILLPPNITPEVQHHIAQFIRLLWDIGLEVGHSTRTIDECVEAARDDLTIISNLLETRLLIGSKTSFRKLKTALDEPDLWPINKFFQAKWKEQLQRYRKYGETAYNLEPNIKNSPGGLRDIQMIGWVIKRYYGAKSLHTLIKHDFLTKQEYQNLIDARSFLWKVRFGIHLLTKRREDRLLFHYQNSLAKQFGYKDQPHHLAVEQFMKDYFRVIKSLRELNDMLLQLFREAILNKGEQQITSLNERFQICNRYIEVTHDNVFLETPSALLEIFILITQNPQILGVRARTIRLIRQHKHLINAKYRKRASNQQLFISLLKQSHKITSQLERMNRYGILGKYIPDFAQIIGQMQHDLFHVYTVDQHSLYLVRNLRRFLREDHQADFPLCHKLMSSIEHPELLYITALFHDIAKGRGGDHAALGAEAVKQFCRSHQLSSTDTKLIVWLVRNHLLMSLTTQRNDIYDPQTIENFTSKVGNKRYLDHLYLLTVADIRATNPSLWNSWKDSLLRELYRLTDNLFQQKSNTIDENDIISGKQAKASALLIEQGFTQDQIEQLWPQLSPAYFLHESARKIARQCEAIFTHQDTDSPLVSITQHHTAGGTEIFIYAPIQNYRFAITTAVLANYHLTIFEARIINATNKYSLDSYIVLDQHNQPIDNPFTLASLQQALQYYLTIGSPKPHLSRRRMTRHQRHFLRPTNIKFQTDTHRNRTNMLLTTSDRPGLLALIGKAFVACQILLQNAKITTAGERVEDVFFITDTERQPLDETKQEQLRSILIEYIDHS